MCLLKECQFHLYDGDDNLAGVRHYPKKGRSLDETLQRYFHKHNFPKVEIKEDGKVLATFVRGEDNYILQTFSHPAGLKILDSLQIPEEPRLDAKQIGDFGFEGEKVATDEPFSPPQKAPSYARQLTPAEIEARREAQKDRKRPEPEFGLADISLKDAEGNIVQFNQNEFLEPNDEELNINMTPNSEKVFKEAERLLDQAKRMAEKNPKRLADEIDNVKKSLDIRTKHLYDDAAESIFLLILNNLKTYREMVEYVEQMKQFWDTETDERVQREVYYRVDEFISKEVDKFMNTPLGPF